MDGAACCKSGAGADTPEKLLRCFRCHGLHHTSCCPEIDRRNCSDACLLEAKPREVPSWVRDLAAVDVSALSRKNRFCPTCLVGFSGRRCPTAHSHAGGQGAAIEIHVRGEGDSLRAFVDVMQIHGLYDCSEIKQEMDLASPPTLLRRLVPLHPAKGPTKEYCGSVRIGSESLYCSMECEVQWRADPGAPGHQFVKTLLAEDFTTGHQQDAFCTSCRVAFCSAVHSDHVDHPSVEIILNGGWFFARIPATEKWIGNLRLCAGGWGGLPIAALDARSADRLTCCILLQACSMGLSTVRDIQRCSFLLPRLRCEVDLQRQPSRRLREHLPSPPPWLTTPPAAAAPWHSRESSPCHLDEEGKTCPRRRGAQTGRPVLRSACIRRRLRPRPHPPRALSTRSQAVGASSPARCCREQQQRRQFSFCFLPKSTKLTSQIMFLIKSIDPPDCTPPIDSIWLVQHTNRRSLNRKGEKRETMNKTAIRENGRPSDAADGGYGPTASACSKTPQVRRSAP